MTNRHIAIIGGGSWGTAAASVLAARHDVTLWALEPEVIEGINERNENPIFHPGVELPGRLRAHGDLAATVDGADLIVMAVPTQFIRDVVGRAQDAFDSTVPIVSLAKGIEAETFLRPTQIICEQLGADLGRVGVLSGPNLAREVVTGSPASAVLAFSDHDLAVELQAVFDARTFEVFTNDDVIGCELGGALKNVVAVAAGMAAGKGHGPNALAALISRGLVEMARLGMALGARPETFLGLAGQGDLVATCLSEQSRNHRFGRALATGRSVEDVAKDTNMVAEGVKSVPAVVALSERENVAMPLARLVYDVVHDHATVDEAFENLRSTDPEHELAGFTFPGP